MSREEMQDLVNKVGPHWLFRRDEEAIKEIQSYVDQQTRKLREALAHIEVAATMGVGSGGFPPSTTAEDRLKMIIGELAALSNNIQEPLTGAEKKEEG